MVGTTYIVTTTEAADTVKRATADNDDIKVGQVDIL